MDFTPPTTRLGLTWPPAHWPDVRYSEQHTVSGIHWHVQRSGRVYGTAPTLLLVHGTGGGTHSWAGVTADLAPHFHIVNVDLPGHGFTHVPAEVERRTNPYSLPGMARALGALLEHLDVQPQLAAGHSAGVAVMMRATLDGLLRPDRMVGFCPALVPPPAWYVAFAAPLMGLLVESDLVSTTAATLAANTRVVQQLLGTTGSTLTDAQLARYAQLCATSGHVHGALTMMARWDLPTLHRDSGAWRTPLTLVAARGDRWIPLSALHRAVAGLPQVTLIEEEGGHLLPEERPQVIVRELTNVTR